MSAAIPYDLVIIGGGPAGIAAAATAGAFGKTVAVIDSHSELGGAGTNTGTVPSKTLPAGKATLVALATHGHQALGELYKFASIDALLRVSDGHGLFEPAQAV